MDEYQGTMPEVIPRMYDELFGNLAEKRFAEYLIDFLVFGVMPETTPALWQDVEIYIRYKKRDVWSLDESGFVNARKALVVYQAKYVIEHLKKAEILGVLNKFFRQVDEDGDEALLEMFEEKLHAPINSLIMVQEKLIVGKDDLGKFDELFRYPGWIEFSDEANEAVFEKILKNELTDEQIDYFFGASDTMRGYDKWFKVTKHVLMTTKNAHTFWTAGDVLSIIWRAIPEDEAAQKWFKDEIFEIFWSRVGSIWPMINRDKLDLDEDGVDLLMDAISWLNVLDDLKERLPELGDDYELEEHPTSEEEFGYEEDVVLEMVDEGGVSTRELLNEFFELTELACEEKLAERLKEIAEKEVIPAIVKLEDSEDELNEMVDMMAGAVKHAEKCAVELKQERGNMEKLRKGK
ncbi:MAG: hypothetical protein Q4F56_02985 [Candidatus Saccharibacteria bacterium]|nr:hypothetical protein [Candidatus Saccharibacteria bacterium]